MVFLKERAVNGLLGAMNSWGIVNIGESLSECPSGCTVV